MRSFRNNNKRSRYRSNGERNFKRNGENQSFSNNVNFQRKSPGRNNHNAPKLIEKYNNLAREALSSGDKILSENYFQHADHFTRILTEQDNLKRLKNSDNKHDEKSKTFKDDKDSQSLSDKKAEDEKDTIQSEVN